MRIGLIDVDGHNFPNLALMKLSAHHKALGDSVEWVFPLDHYDRVYQSKVFDETYSPDIDFVPNAEEIIKGGTGYDIKSALPDEIEHIYPDYGLYPKLTQDTAYGYLTRGCPRGCDFCIVAEKEGRASLKAANLSEFWRGQKHIKLLDPNLLACRERGDLLGQLAESRADVDFTQGLDIRLTSADVVGSINHIKIKEIHFAWDNPRDDLREDFRRYADLASRKPHDNFATVYVLVNFGSSLDEDLYRIYTLRELGFRPYVMVYDKPHAPRIARDLQRWCNNIRIFRAEPNFEKYRRA